MTISAWWVLWAFVGGGSAGVLLMALMFVASAEEDQMEALKSAVTGDLPDEAHGVA